MTKKDLMELKRRLKKDSCTFTRMCGCYVNPEKEKMTFSENFLNLPDDSFYKFLDISKKVLSGKVADSMLEAKFPLEEEAPGGKQQFFMGLRDSRLKNEQLLDVFYDMIISSYDCIGSYLILIFHDAYDIIVKTTDNNKIDESEEVYEYLLCAICPVSLSKPGLSVFTEKGTVGPRIRDWVVGSPETGFLFPAFSDRSSDIHSLGFFSKEPQKPHYELLSDVFSCPYNRTASEKSESFKEIIRQACPDNSDRILSELNREIRTRIDAEPESGARPVTSEAVQELMQDAGASPDTIEEVKIAYENEFDNDLPTTASLIEQKSVKSLERKSALAEFDEIPATIKTYDVILRVKPQKESQITTRVIDGQKFILIPMNDNERATVNGVNKEL